MFRNFIYDRKKERLKKLSKLCENEGKSPSYYYFVLKTLREKIQKDKHVLKKIKKTYK